MTTNHIGDLVVGLQDGGLPARSSPFPLGAGSDKFGLGFQLQVAQEDGVRPPGSYSWAGLMNTHFWGDPVNDIAVVFLTQLLPFYDERCISVLRQFENRVYENLE